MESNIHEQLQDVLGSDDVDALKSALQNLMVLFEMQNRNYLELKNQVKAIKMKRPLMKQENCDAITIAAEDNRPPTEGFVDESYELLAAIRRSRKTHNRTAVAVEKTLNTLITNEENRNAQIETIMSSK